MLKLTLAPYIAALTGTLPNGVSAATGDNTLLWIGLMAGAVVLLILMKVFGKKKK